MIFSSHFKFDENEWFVIVGLVVLFFIFIFNCKHFPPAFTFVILLFTACLGITTDYILATDYPYDFYDAMDTTKYDLFDFIMSNINYGLYGYLSIYFYDKWRIKGGKWVSYILMWLALSLLLEIISVKLHVIKYNDWNLGLSVIAYLVIFSTYLLMLKVGKRAMQQYQASNSNI